MSNYLLLLFFLELIQPASMSEYSCIEFHIQPLLINNKYRTNPPFDWFGIEMIIKTCQDSNKSVIIMSSHPKCKAWMKSLQTQHQSDVIEARTRPFPYVNWANISPVSRDQREGKGSENEKKLLKSLDLLFFNFFIYFHLTGFKQTNDRLVSVFTFHKKYPYPLLLHASLHLLIWLLLLNRLCVSIHDQRFSARQNWFSLDSKLTYITRDENISLGFLLLLYYYFFHAGDRKVEDNTCGLPLFVFIYIISFWSCSLLMMYKN